MREYEPGETTHMAPVPGQLDAELVDKNTRPDCPADTVSAAAEQKGSEHCARIALVVRNLGAGDGLGARVDDVAPTVPADAAGQTGLAAMDASTVVEWTGSEGTTEPGRVHRRPGVVLRRLSHAEVARLQTFPDDWPWRGPSTAVYRQIGNAVPVLLAERVGEAIAEALRQAPRAVTAPPEPTITEQPQKRKKKPRPLL